MVEVDQDKKLAEVLQLRESLRHKAFYMMFEVLVIFGAPAAGGYFLGKYLTEDLGFGKWVQVVILVGTFVASWFILYFRHKAFDRKLKDVNVEIKRLREEQVQGPQTIETKTNV